MVVTHTRGKNQDQGSVGSKDRAETDGRTARRTDGGDCITFRANAVGKTLLSALPTPWRRKQLAY